MNLVSQRLKSLSDETLRLLCATGKWNLIPSDSVNWREFGFVDMDEALESSGPRSVHSAKDMSLSSASSVPLHNYLDQRSPPQSGQSDLARRGHDTGRVSVTRVTEEREGIRIAVVGGGPAGLLVAINLLELLGESVCIDIFEIQGDILF